MCRLGTRVLVQGHHVWSRSAQKWIPSRMKPHPKLRVRVTVSKTDYKIRGFPAPACHQAQEMEALADTGAMMVVLGLQEAVQLGVRREELLPTMVTIQVANGEMVKALGMILLVISCKDEAGVLRTMRQQAYVIDGAGQLFLSHEALEELGCIKGEVFPWPMVEVGQVSGVGEGEDRTCKCPERSLPLWHPASIPF